MVDSTLSLKEAMFYEKVEGQDVQCLLCPRECVIPDGKAGSHLSPTPVSTLESAYKIAKKNGLRYVYIGNVPGHVRNSTFCPFCNRKVIHRTNFDILEMSVANGNCKFCYSPLPGRWT
jgi:hypothetical protein